MMRQISISMTTFFLLLLLTACGGQPTPETTQPSAAAPQATTLTPTAAPAGTETVPTSIPPTPTSPVLSTSTDSATPAPVPTARSAIQEYPVPARSHPHDVAPAADCTVWYTAQYLGALGQLDPQTGETHHIPLGEESAPHGVIVGPAGAAWVTGAATPGQGARRVWSDSQGRIWVSEWNVGQLALYDPATGAWQEWHLPGDSPRPCAVYVDHQDMVWLSDFGANALVRFDPGEETFTNSPCPPPARPCAKSLAGRVRSGAQSQRRIFTYAAAAAWQVGGVGNGIQRLLQAPQPVPPFVSGVVTAAIAV